MTLKDAVRIAKKATMQEMEIQESLTCVFDLIVLLKELLYRIADYYVVNITDFSTAWDVLYGIIEFEVSLARKLGGSVLAKIKAQLNAFFPE